MGAEIGHEAALGEWPIAAPELGDADGACQIVVAPPSLTMAIRVWRGGVHPSAIGVLQRGLNGVWAAGGRLVPQLTEALIVDPEVVGDLVEHRLANLAAQSPWWEPQFEMGSHEHGDPIGQEPRVAA